MPWDIRINSTENWHCDLSTAEVREHLARGLLGPEDWAQNSETETWAQIATLDEFEDVVAQDARRRRVPQWGSQEIDMTPMIDVTFLLLIFFMITATFQMQKGLNFPPDKTSDTSEVDAKVPGLSDFGDHIIVEITDKDRFWIRKPDSTDAKDGAVINTNEVAEAIRSEAHSVKKNKLMIVSHELASHEAVVAVIDASALAGITSVTLADITTPALQP